mgnify:CR=1 FL=1
MKKRWIVFTVLLIVALTAFLYIRFFFVFGEGVKSGELNYVVYKGLVFKTYEGKLIQSGIRSKTAGTIQSYEFEFSVENEALARKLMLLGGKNIELHSGFFCQCGKQSEFHLRVAPDTGIRSPSRQVFTPEIRENHLLVLL